jgi:5-methylcytosine-specific restriction protein A
MYVALEDAKDIERAQKTLLRELKKALPPWPGKFTFGHQGRNFPVDDLRSNGLIWFIYHKDTVSKIKRHWNAFGIADQLRPKGSNKIVAETNVALRGGSRRVAGLFVRDATTKRLLLVHSGKVGGGKKGIGKTEFLKVYKGNPIDYAYPSAPKSLHRAYVVAELGSGNLVKDVSDFVQSVARFKGTQPEAQAAALSDKELAKLVEKVAKHPKAVSTKSTVYPRNAFIAEYAKRRAAGHCDLCRSPAPFKSAEGKPYLECHHIKWLAHLGADRIENAVALCPNCHRKMHVVSDAKDIAKLQRRAERRL